MWSASNTCPWREGTDMERPVIRRLVFTLCIVCGGASNAFAVSASKVLDKEQMEKMELLADIARAGSDSRVISSRIDTSKRTKSVTTPTPPVLISIQGDPAFVYTRGKDYGVPEGKLEFAMRCRGNGVVDLSMILRAVPPTNVNTGKLMPLSMYMKPGEDYDLVINGKVFPVQWAETIPNYALLVRVVASMSASGEVLSSLRGNTALSYYLKQPVEVIGSNEVRVLRGRVDLISFRDDVGLLLEHCRAGNPNPMDQEMGPATNITDSPMPAAPIEVNLDFLPVNERHEFTRILKGEPRSMEASLRQPFLNFFAFHIAFWEECGPDSDAPMDYYFTTPLSQLRLVGIYKDDYAAFVVAASAFQPLSRLIYDREFSNDFSFSVVTDRFDQLMLKKKEMWFRIIENYGCSGRIQNTFRKAVNNDLPYFEYKDGSRRVLVEYERTSFELNLPQPLKLEMSRQIGAAEIASVNDAIFNNSYPSQVLRSIAIGNFAQVGRLEADLTEVASNPFAGNPNNAMSKFLSSAMAVDTAMRRQSNIITAYAIARMHILGKCGDDTLTYQQDRIYWTDYTNGLGQYVGSSAPTYQTDYAEIPLKFNDVVKSQNSITASDFLSREVGAVVSKLSCRSRLRRQLEDNMIAYFKGRDPAHIAPISGN